MSKTNEIAKIHSQIKHKVLRVLHNDCQHLSQNQQAMIYLMLANRLLLMADCDVGSVGATEGLAYEDEVC